MIIRERRNNQVRGLTTAASLLFAAALGIGVALSQWLLAAGTTILVLVTLQVLPYFERIIEERIRERKTG